MAAIISTQDFLSQNIQSLGFSKAFQDICRQQRLYTLKDIVDLGKKEICYSNTFTITWFNELMSFLQQYRLLYLLDH